MCQVQGLQLVNKLGSQHACSSCSGLIARLLSGINRVQFCTGVRAWQLQHVSVVYVPVADYLHALCPRRSCIMAAVEHIVVDGTVQDQGLQHNSTVAIC
jgi:hypothetical protein